MTLTAPSIADLTVNVIQEIQVRASLETTFEAILEELGPGNQAGDGKPMPLIIEPWPGGRWYRDLGGKDGHFWAHVQAIKRPSLLELTGPLFMSYPVISNVQYRLSESGGVTTIKFHHAAFGLIQEPHKTGMVTGWGRIHDRVRAAAESGRSR